MNLIGFRRTGAKIAVERVSLPPGIATLTGQNEADYTEKPACCLGFGKVDEFSDEGLRREP